MTTKNILPYGAILIGMPFAFLLSGFLLANTPGSGRIVYIIPLVCLTVFLLAIPFSTFQRKWLHLIIGLITTLIIWFVHIIIFGLVAFSRNGFEGVQ